MHGGNSTDRNWYTQLTETGTPNWQKLVHQTTWCMEVTQLTETGTPNWQKLVHQTTWCMEVTQLTETGTPNWQKLVHQTTCCMEVTHWIFLVRKVPKEPTGQGTKPNFFQSNRENCQKISAEVSSFSQNCDCEWGQRSPHWYHTIQTSSVCHHTTSERNWSINVWLQGHVKQDCRFSFSQRNQPEYKPEFIFFIFFLKAKSAKLGSLVWWLIRQDKISWYIIPTSLNSSPNSIWIHSGLCETDSTQVFAFFHHFDPESRPRSQRWSTKMQSSVVFIITPNLNQTAS